MPAWPLPLYEVPEGAGVVRDAQVTKLVDGDVVEDLERRKHEPPVEGERAAGRAGTPRGCVDHRLAPASSERPAARPPRRQALRRAPAQRSAPPARTPRGARARAAV